MLGYCATFRGEGHEGIWAFTSTLKSFLSFSLNLLIQSHFISSFLFLYILKNKSHIAHISLLSHFSLTFCLISLFSHKNLELYSRCYNYKKTEARAQVRLRDATLWIKATKDKILARLYRHGNQRLTCYPLILTSHPFRGYLPSSTSLTIPTTSTCASLSFPYLPQLSRQFVKLRAKLCTFQLKGSLRPTLPFLVVRPNRIDAAIRLGLLQLEVFLRDIQQNAQPFGLVQ